MQQPTASTTKCYRYAFVALTFLMVGGVVSRSADAQQNEAPAPAASAQDELAQNFLIQHEIGHRFRIDPTDLPGPKTSPIVSNRSLIVPYSGQVPQVPAGFTATSFATGLANPRRLFVLPNGDVLVAEQSAGYLTLLRDDGSGHAAWIDRHVEDLNRPYGLAWRGNNVLVADQDGIWSVPHNLGALRAGRSEVLRVDQVPPEERKPVAGAYGARLITKKGVFGIIQGHQNRPLAIDPKTGALFVGVGSSGNLGVEPEPKATIQRFDANGSNQATFASGMRNPTALAFHPQTGELYALVQERDGLGDRLPSDYLTRVQEGGFYGWPYAYNGQHPQAGFASLAPEKSTRPLLPIFCSRRIRRRWTLCSTKASNSRLSTKVMHSWCSEVRGTVRNPPATRWCACRSKMAGPKATMRISSPGFGCPVRDAPRFGDVPPRLRSPRMARCWLPTILPARSGALPMSARATVLRSIPRATDRSCGPPMR